MRLDDRFQSDRLMQIAPGIARGRVVVPDRLSERERDALSRTLYAVHQGIFAGVSAEAFHRHVIAPPADATWIQPYLSADDDVIGYCAVHRYWRQVRHRDVIVLRAEAGLAPGYRGRGATYGFGIMRAFIEKLTHPFTPVYFLGTLVHPSSYHLFLKYFPRVYPHPDLGTPADIEEIELSLIETFPDPAVHPTDPFVRDVGWVTIPTPQERILAERDDRPDVKFFQARNPGYTSGHGLVVLVPMTAYNLGAALASRLRERALLALRYRQADL